MAFTESIVDPALGSNLNAGSSAGAALVTYTSAVVVGGWDQAIGVFTVGAGGTGNPVTDGVTVGMFCSVYVTAGATAATFVSRITARDATTVTVSLTAVSGAPPATDALGATTMKVGGAWAGPSGAVAFPFNFVAAAMTNVAGDTPRVNFKSGTTYSITAAMTHTLAGPVRFQGYTTTVEDGGKFIIDGGTGGVSYVPLTISGANIDFVDAVVQNNGASGGAAGITWSGAEGYAARVVVNSVRGNGFVASGGGTFAECEAYACNQSNTSSSSGFSIVSTGGAELIRCIAHDNAGSNSSGFRATVQAAFRSCIADTNGAVGFNLALTISALLSGCDAYANASDGILLGNASAALFYIENCNLVKNGGWGINGSGAGARNGAVRNCGFGSGTQVNTSGTTTGLKSMTETDSVVYAADVTPWAAPLTGDFRISLPAAKGTGRGTFTQTQAGYSGTVGYPDRGAAQHRGGGNTGIPSIGRGVAQ